MAETKRMTAEQVVSYLLEEDGLDFLRESLTWVVQQLMEAEVSELVGAARGGLGDDLPVNLRGRPCRSVADRRRSQKLAIDRFGFGRRICAELLREQPPAPLVHLQRLGPIARRRMSLHQPPVPALPKRLETDRLLGPLRRLRGVAETQAGVAQHGQRADTDVVELAPFLLDPGAVLPWQERLRHQRPGQLGIGSRPFEIARRERLLGLVGRDRRCSQVDPRSFRQLEPVTTERVRQRASAVEARVRERAPQLARDHRQRLFPGRGRHRPPEHLGKLVSRYQPPLPGNEICEDEPALPAGETSLVQHYTVGLDCDATRQKHPQLHGAAIRCTHFAFPDETVRTARLGAEFSGRAGIDPATLGSRAGLTSSAYFGAWVWGRRCLSGDICRPRWRTS